MMLGKKSTTGRVIDPICGMRINPAAAAAMREHNGVTFYFCASGCAKTFDADPARYARS